MKNHFVFALRGIKKNLLTSSINIFGLSIAFAASLLILYYVNQELSHDKFHKNSNNIFQLTYSMQEANNVLNKSSLFNYTLAERLKLDVPQIKRASPYRYGWGAITQYQENTFDDRLAIVQPDFLKMFSFPLIEGSAESALQTPDGVVITKRFADKLLKDNSAGYGALIGEPIEFLNIENGVFSISGILDDLPETSSIRFDVLINYENQRYFGQSNNSFGNSSLYIELFPETDALVAEENTKEVLLSFYEETISKMKLDGKLMDTPDCFEPQFQNITEIYFSGDYSGYEVHSSKNYSIILSIIGLIIMFTACINYLLFSFGQTLKRVHQIGVFKVFGSSRSQILKQFWTEAFVITSISLLIGLTLSYLLYPLFEQLAQRSLDLSLMNRSVIPVFVIIACLIITLINSFPIIYAFQNVNPAILLKKQIVAKGRNWISNSFVLFQYFIAAVLILSTLVILRQTKFMKDVSPGFDPDNIIELSIPSDFNFAETQLFKAQLLANPGIISIGGNDKGYSGNTSSYYVKNDKGETHTIRLIRIDNDFIKTMGITIIDGDDFTRENLSQTNDEIIVNEKFFSVMNMEKRTDSFVNITNWQEFKIKGIVNDFHFDSMKEEIEPLIFISNTNYERIRYLYIKCQANLSSEVISLVENTWNTIAPGRVMQYSHLNSLLESRYKDEERWGKIVGVASFLGILISTLGLFGMTLMVVNRRIKEIGIRKINGANMKDIMLMLNRNFITKIFIAYIIACPVAYFIMSKWLEGFAYKISISPMIYIMSGLIIISTAILTVNWQCWSAARKNPVDTLRYE